MPNADQCRSMPINILALIPMSSNSDQCRSMSWAALGIDRGSPVIVACSYPTWPLYWLMIILLFSFAQIPLGPLILWQILFCYLFWPAQIQFGPYPLYCMIILLSISTCSHPIWSPYIQIVILLLFILTRSDTTWSPYIQIVILLLSILTRSDPTRPSYSLEVKPTLQATSEYYMRGLFSTNYCVKASNTSVNFVTPCNLNYLSILHIPVNKLYFHWSSLFAVTSRQV